MRRYFRVKWFLANLQKTVLFSGTPVEKWGGERVTNLKIRDYKESKTSQNQDAGLKPRLYKVQKQNARLGRRPLQVQNQKERIQRFASTKNQRQTKTKMPGQSRASTTNLVEFRNRGIGEIEDGRLRKTGPTTTDFA